LSTSSLSFEVRVLLELEKMFAGILMPDLLVSNTGTLDSFSVSRGNWNCTTVDAVTDTE
jgi:hypothetical protein